MGGAGGGEGMDLMLRSGGAWQGTVNSPSPNARNPAKLPKIALHTPFP
jgi:hypothetical protein